MSTRDVGGRPETSGPEEAYRPAASQEPPRQSPLWLRLAGRFERLVLVHNGRFRLQTAGLTALALISLLSFFLLPPRTISIAVDGNVTTVESRAANAVAIVEGAGVELQPGDRVEATGDRALDVRRATDVSLHVDDRTLALRTHAVTIEELLLEVKVPLAPQDSVLRNQRFVAPDAPIVPAPALAALLWPDAIQSVGPAEGEPVALPVALEVRRAVPFSVVENGQRLELRSSRETLATALRDVGVRLGPGDSVQPPLDTELTAGLEVRIEHAIPVVLTMPEGKFILYALSPTVGEALTEGRVDLPPSFRLDPPAETDVSTGLTVHLIVVSEETDLEQERIERRTVYRTDAGLPWGESRVVGGRDGVRFRQYRSLFEDGELISRELVDEWYDPEPLDRTIYTSAAAPPPEVPAGLEVVRVLRVYASWYSPASAGRSPSDPAYGITATGVPVTRGVIAVDPSAIPLGTRMYIPGYGYGVAADTGGGIRGDMIDLGYPDGVVPDWTTRWVDIYILGP